MMTANDQLKALQQLLKDAGYYHGAIDARWGQQSKEAFGALLLAVDRENSGVPATAPEGPTASDRAPDVSNDQTPVDARSEGNIETLHPRVRPLARALVNRAKAMGIKMVITSGTRTYEQQNELYEQGRSKPGQRVTNARGGFSNHNFGLAFDLTQFSGVSPIWESPEYAKLGPIGESLGLTWGGRWTTPVDLPHYELHPDWAEGRSESDMLAVLRELHAAGKDAFA